MTTTLSGIAEELERAVMVCPQCEGEGSYADGLDEAACSTECTRCGGNGWIADVATLIRTADDREGREVGDAPDEITRLKERVRLLEDALSMAFSAIDDHNRRSAFRSIRIEEFHKPVPRGSKITCLTEARQALGGTNA